MNSYPKSPKAQDNKEGFFSLTLGRRKKKEVSDYENELRIAIDGEDTQPEYLGSFQLEENEERSMVENSSLKDPKVIELQKVLTDWINNSLVDQRIIVQDLQEDLFDGQVLQKLLETIGQIKLQVPEVTQTSQGQKVKLVAVLDAVQQQLKLDRWTETSWSVDSIHSKNLVAILHLLVALAKHFKAPIRMPENVRINMVVVTKKDGKLVHKTVQEEITTTLEEMTGGRFARDAFDTLLDHAPDKLSIVKKSLIDFANNQLEILSLSVNDLDKQFSDGINLILLMGLLEGYFVPTYLYSLTPKTFEDKVRNLELAFDLMRDANIQLPKTQPQDIAKCELKSTLRVLYNLFNKYKVKKAPPAAETQ